MQDTRATRLRIPSLGIDSAVSGSQVIADSSSPPPGCPPGPPGAETLSVPAQGIATPEDSFAGLEQRAWIFGHSRWQGSPGLFFVLQEIEIGDEVFIDGVDRRTSEDVANQRFVVDGIYLADRSSGGRLITAHDSAEMPREPLVILQTSVRETGVNRQWILDRETVLGKAVNLIEGDIEDPCKYLLLFVIARAP